MKLLVDVGNTALKLALYNKGVITYINEHEIDWSNVGQLLVASVRQNHSMELLLEKARLKQIPTTIAKVSASHKGVSCAYPAYQNLGIDRWLVVLAAAALYPNQTTIIIDAGTATTLDVLEEGSKHRGGWIIPGIDLMMESIASRAEKVFASKQVAFANQLGSDTPAALSFGCLAASLGLVAQARALYGDNTLVLCTGGYGKLLSEHIENSEFIEDLVLKGLVSYA